MGYSKQRSVGVPVDVPGHGRGRGSRLGIYRVRRGMRHSDSLPLQRRASEIEWHSLHSAIPVAAVY